MISWPVKSEKGAAYLWVLGITAVVMLLATVYIYMVSIDSKIAYSYSSGVRAHYLAESGAELAVSQLYNHLKTHKVLPEESELLADISSLITGSGGSFTVSNDSITVNKPFFNQYNTAHDFTVIVKKDNPTVSLTDYTILSSGTYGTAVRCMRVSLEILEDDNAFEFRQNKWQWEQISKDEFDQY